MAHPKQSSLLLSVRRYSAFFHELPKLLSGKESACSAGDPGDEGLIPGLGRSPEGEHDNPLLYSCLKNSHGQRSLAGYSPWGCTESDITEDICGDSA